MSRNDLTAEQARALLEYRPETGDLLWRLRPREMFQSDRACNTFNSRFAGKDAGCLRSDGYSTLAINYKQYLRHVVIWLIEHGEWPRDDDPKYFASIEKQRKLCQPSAKESRRVNQLKYAAENREQERQRVAKWREDFPEKATETHRIYYLKNSDEVRAANKAYRLAHLETYLEYSNQYQHRKRAGGGRLTKGYRSRLMKEQDGLCLACGCDLSKSGFHLDHKVPLSKGGLHHDDNVQLLCPPCNRRKSAKNFEDFLKELQRMKAA